MWNTSEQPLWKTLREAQQTSPDQVLAALEVRFPAVPVEDMVERLGIRMSRVKTPGWSGAVNAGPGTAEIWLAAEEAGVRQRFTLAHEIGHLLLHPLGMAYRDISFKGTPQEVQANQFAAELLMPEWMLRPALSITGPDVARMAALFEVSEPAMAQRLDSLGVKHG